MLRKPVLFTLGNAVCNYLAPIELWGGSGKCVAGDGLSMLEDALSHPLVNFLSSAERLEERRQLPAKRFHAIWPT
jgi:hypothetical protein